MYLWTNYAYRHTITKMVYLIFEEKSKTDPNKQVSDMVLKVWF